MKFYRPVTEEDFTIRYENNLPVEVTELIEKGQVIEAKVILRQNYSLGLPECKRYCSAYQAFLSAKKDFYDGKPVFTEY
ncbi:hypothetical protein ACFVS2_21430 [Brevibacillus sp. NPDC058079]|uniref:hypothetical protein n=1 Tax=Brevibacillus sp. NPDC058079 TaxID=3346330 RepID=UPI0036EADF5E